MTLDAWRKEIRLAHQSAEVGHHRAALRRLGRLRRSLERAENRQPAASTRWYRALVHQIEAGVHARAGERSKARIAYLRAASSAFGDLWGSLDLITNSLWAAERAATRADRRATNRVAQIRYLDDRGARLKSIIGDVLNERLVAAGMPPIIFGGKYPARIVPLPYKSPSPYTRADRRIGLGIGRTRPAPRGRRPTTRRG